MTEMENYYQKNLELWQQFGESYTGKVIAAFEKNLEQSQVYQDQMHKALTQVFDSQFNLVMSGLKAMEDQTIRLTKTFDESLKKETTKK